MQDKFQVPCAARKCESVTPRVAASACSSPLGLTCGTSLRKVTVSCFSLTLASSIPDAREWPVECLAPLMPSSSASSSSQPPRSPTALKTAILGISATTVTAPIAHDTGTSTAEASDSAPSPLSELSAVLARLASSVAETVEDCPIQESTSTSGQFSDFVDSPKGLPSCDLASARYVYSAWQACFSAESEQPINCAALDWSTATDNTTVRISSFLCFSTRAFIASQEPLFVVMHRIADFFPC